MFNQKNKVTCADYEQWRAGQDETVARIASDPDRLLFHVEPELGSTTPMVWFRLVIRITSIINTIRSMLRMAVQCFGTI